MKRFVDMVEVGWACDLTSTQSIPTDSFCSRAVGRFRAEFLAEKSIVKIRDLDDRIATAVKILPPRSLSSKTG